MNVLAETRCCVVDVPDTNKPALATTFALTKLPANAPEPWLVINGLIDNTAEPIPITPVGALLATKVNVLEPGNINVIVPANVPVGADVTIYVNVLAPTEAIANGPLGAFVEAVTPEIVIEVPGVMP
jgi:hypothetical protein